MTTDPGPLPPPETAPDTGADEYGPFFGFPPAVTPIPIVDSLSDDDLRELNRLLPWSCFVADSQGRRFGRPAGFDKLGAPKRGVANPVPDRRIRRLAERIDLSGLTVLEIGCFEGVHTTALAQRARLVKACDSRLVNLAKTAVRCAMYQTAPSLFLWNVELEPPEGQDISCDVLHHVGVLYHLADPIGHLRRVAPFVAKAILLDTHFSADDAAVAPYTAGGETFLCREVNEGGVANVFSGMYSNARWLKLEDLERLLRDLGFTELHIEPRMERNGPRVEIFAQRGRSRPGKAQAAKRRRQRGEP
jgi:hypothetical protein